MATVPFALAACGAVWTDEEERPEEPRRSYVRHFTGDRCEARRCRIRTWFLWPVNGGQGLVRACCPAHFEQAQREQEEQK